MKALVVDAVGIDIWVGLNQPAPAKALMQGLAGDVRMCCDSGK